MRSPGNFGRDPVGELEGVHLGHHDVRDEQVDVRVVTCQLDRMTRRARLRSRCSRRPPGPAGSHRARSPGRPQRALFRSWSQHRRVAPVRVIPRSGYGARASALTPLSYWWLVATGGQCGEMSGSPSSPYGTHVPASSCRSLISSSSTRWLNGTARFHALRGAQTLPDQRARRSGRARPHDEVVARDRLRRRARRARRASPPPRDAA